MGETGVKPVEENTEQEKTITEEPKSENTPQETKEEENESVDESKPAEITKDEEESQTETNSRKESPSTTDTKKATSKSQKKKGSAKPITIAAANKELKAIANFGAKSKSPAVKNNIIRATEMGFELIRKHNLLTQEHENFVSKEADFNKAQEEYKKTAEVLTNLVEQLISCRTII